MSCAHLFVMIHDCSHEVDEKRSCVALFLRLYLIKVGSNESPLELWQNYTPLDNHFYWFFLLNELQLGFSQSVSVFHHYETKFCVKIMLWHKFNLKLYNKVTIFKFHIISLSTYLLFMLWKHALHLFVTYVLVKWEKWILKYYFFLTCISYNLNINHNNRAHNKIFLLLIKYLMKPYG